MQSTVVGLLGRTWQEHEHRLYPTCKGNPPPDLGTERDSFHLRPIPGTADPDLVANAAQSAVFKRHQEGYDMMEGAFRENFHTFFKANTDEFIDWVASSDLNGDVLCQLDHRHLADPHFWVINHCWLSVARMAAADKFEGGALHREWWKWRAACPNMIIVGGGFDHRLVKSHIEDLLLCGPPWQIAYVLIDSPGGFVAACDEMKALRAATKRRFVGVVPNRAKMISCGALTGENLHFVLLGELSGCLLHDVRKEPPGGSLSLQAFKDIVTDLERVTKRVEAAYVFSSHSETWRVAWGNGDFDKGKQKWANYVVDHMCTWEKVVNVHEARVRDNNAQALIRVYLHDGLSKAIDEELLWGFFMWAHDNYEDLTLTGLEYAEVNGCQARVVMTD